jgi:hypothetical protein
MVATMNIGYRVEGSHREFLPTVCEKECSSVAFKLLGDSRCNSAGPVALAPAASAFHEKKNYCT